jgi:glycosyltransferase involved in cell wall biosynthesis
MLRNYFLCFELSKYYKVTLLTFQEAEDFADGTEGYQWNPQINVVTIPVPSPKPKGLKKFYNSVKGRIYQGNMFRSTGDYHLYGFPCLKSLVSKEDFSFVVFAHMSSLELSYLVKKYSKNTVSFLDAHNVDHLLFEQENDLSQPLNKKRHQFLKKGESSIYKYVDFFLACSTQDKTILETINHNRIAGFTIPNGADTYRNQFQIEKRIEGKHLLFCGSLDYEPNIDGLKWFHSEVWPLIKKADPSIRFTIIGRNAGATTYQELKADQSIDFVGEVDEVKKYYYQSSLAIVPLRKGSGTRLKILEAMSLGTPVVSTSIGAEGIDCSHNSDIVIADDIFSFVRAVLDLLNDNQKAEFIRLNARKLIDDFYGWDAIGKKLASVFQHVDKESL